MESIFIRYLEENRVVISAIDAQSSYYNAFQYKTKEDLKKCVIPFCKEYSKFYIDIKGKRESVPTLEEFLI